MLQIGTLIEAARFRGARPPGGDGKARVLHPELQGVRRQPVDAGLGIQRAVEILAACFGGAPLWSAADGYTLKSYAVTFLVLAAASTTLGKRCWQRLPDKAQKLLTPVLMFLALAVSTAYLVDGSYNPFLYFRF